MARRRRVAVTGVLLALAVAGAWVLLSPSRGPVVLIDEEKAVKAIKKLGGSVTVDENAPGRPVVRVDLSHT